MKSPKIYFLDTGIAVRLRGWMDNIPLMNSPQAGSLFESLVFSEIIKCKNNFNKQWKISFWRTKEGEEVDFIIENQHGKIIALDAKMAIHNVTPIKIPHKLAENYPHLDNIIIVTFGGNPLQLNQQCMQLPIKRLTEFLLSFDDE